MSLELSGKVTGNIRKYLVKANAEDDGKTAYVYVEVPLDEVQAEKLGGKLFARTCFSDFVGKSGASTVDGKKLGGELAIKAEHTIEFDGYKVSTKPKVTHLRVGDGRVVSVTLCLPVPGSAKKLRHQLEECTGDDIELRFIGVTQAEVPGTEEDKRHGFEAAKKGNGAAEANA